MAIKIGTDNIVRVIRPSDTKFSLNDLNNLVEGFIEPTKIGPVWLMQDEDARRSGKPQNTVASFFFGQAVYGTILVVPPQQLPTDWDAIDDDEQRYTADDVDSGFLLSLQKALIRNRVLGNNANTMEQFQERFRPQEEWSYRPPDQDEIDENTHDFYRKVYDYISQNPKQFHKNILLNDIDILVKLEKPEDREKMINQMLDFFVSTEEYEKCAVLKSIF